MISVIVPVHNAAARLQGCIDSLRAQTLEDLQMIFVDDGSSDGSGAMLDAAAALDGRIVVVHRANGGPAAARNTALEHVAGEWIMFVDADDRIEPDYAQALLDTALSESAQLVVSDCLIEEEGATRRFGHIVADMAYGSTDEIFQELLAERLPWSLWGKLYAAGLFADLRFCEDDYIAEDLDANMRIFARKGLRLATDSSTGYLYHVEQGSVDHSFTERHLCQLDVFERLVGLVHHRGIKTQASVEVFYAERVLACFGKAIDAGALSAEVRRAFRRAIASHRVELLIGSDAGPKLKLRLIAASCGPRLFGALHRLFG